MIEDGLKERAEGIGIPALEGGGECGRVMRALDWAATPLGAPASWPQTLRTVVGIMLGSRQPMLVVWGPARITLYNDGYAAMCGNRHPGALGRPFEELWHDIWADVEPILERAYAGESTHMDDITFVMHRHGFPEETHFAFSYTPVRSDAGEVQGMFCACTETTEQVIAQRRLSGERERLRQLFEEAPSFMAILEGPEHRFVLANPAYLKVVSHRDVIGRTIAEALPEAVAQGYGETLDAVFRSGKAFVSTDAKFAVQAEPGGPVVERYLDFVYQPITDGQGRVTGIFVEGSDVTERRLADEQRTDLMRELAHRMKNTLAMVQAIVTQTLRTSKSLEAGSEAIAGRLAALARGQDILTQTSWAEADIHDVVEGALVPHIPGPNRIRAHGPRLDLTAQRALGLSLAVHELATNAAKYGSLSTEAGRVDVEWSLPSPGAFLFCWIESGGPLVATPGRSGFGSRLVERIVASYFDGEAKLDFEPNGLRFTLRGTLKDGL